MKNFLINLLLLAIPCSLSAQDASALVKKIRDKFETVNDYSATGKLKTDVSFLKIPETDVTIFYKKPDKFRIKRKNGVSVLPKGGVSVNLHAFLTREDLISILIGETVIDGRKLKIVRMVSSKEESTLASATLYIDEKALLIYKASISSKDNGTYEMEMSYGKYASSGLPDKVIFTFNTKEYKLPKGITVDFGDEKTKKPEPGSEKGKVEISYSSYTINKGIDDTVFSEK